MSYQYPQNSDKQDRLDEMIGTTGYFTGTVLLVLVIVLAIAATMRLLYELWPGGCQ